MKLYLAASFDRQDEIDGYRCQLAEAGHIVVSRWTSQAARWRGSSDMDDATDGDIIRWATDDISDIQEAEAIASFTDGKNARGGRHVEFGLGIGLKKQLIVIGPFEHVFHYLPDVVHYNSPEEFMEAMGA